jgi:AraC-like DNA-binding protein/ligand-binding sensor protein
MQKTDRAPAGVAKVLADIESVTGTGAVFHGLHSPSCLTNRSVCDFCALCLKQEATRSFCRASCREAALNSLASGEPYYYRCWAGLLFVTVAVAPDNHCEGALSLGGFVAPDAEGEVEAILRERLTPFLRADPEPFLRRIASLRAIAPEALRGLGMYALEASFSCGVNAPSFFARQNAKYVQQREIAQAYADLKLHAPSAPDIPRDAYQLLSYLSRHEHALAMQHLSTYLAKLLLMSNWDPVRLKAYLRVLLAVLTSHDILSGMSWAAATHRELRYLGRIEAARTTEDSCYEVAACIREHFGESRYDASGGRTVSERAAAWLLRHYQEDARLGDAARAIGVSVSALSHALKRETGRTFRELRRETRLAEAKRLLATTDVGIGEVAALCGFVDQSHLTHRFREAFNLTPRGFRRLLHPTTEDILAG